ncbi:cell division protein FtsL [Oricola cellulosilytica]|uniref:Cell division protein FtsL n=1 Tax=Oricola cellulosilytica TaxID=1429082 RepID=A0A4R0PF23_9HYPH|nr:hypothetical protein [Oricola cellulosilytica]TCD15248.1 hypothetical protein E0D97_06830 [Oricola cellulosilytica]
MIRLFNIVLVLLMLGAATWTYNVKHRAERDVAEIRSLKQRIAVENDSISLLEADWAYLSQPSRLQKLSDLYAEELQLRPTEAQQLVYPRELPAPPEMPIGDPVADIIAGEITDALTTGSVGGN